jgi:hypothetical protein
VVSRAFDFKIDRCGIILVHKRTVPIEPIGENVIVVNETVKNIRRDPGGQCFGYLPVLPTIIREHRCPSADRWRDKKTPLSFTRD